MQCIILFVHQTVVDSVHAAFIKWYLKNTSLSYVMYNMDCNFI